MSQKINILYLGGFKLPNKNAASHRVIELRKIINSIGGSLYAIGVNSYSKDLEKISEVDYEVPYPSSIIQWIKYLFSIRYFRAFLKIHQEINIVVLYNYQSLASYRIIKFCRKNDIRIISDSTEWYSGNSGNLLFRLIKKLDTFTRMRYINRISDSIIVVSTYLKNIYYKRDVFVIPMLFTKTIFENGCTRNKIVKLSYNGVPFVIGKRLKKRSDAKDRLDIVIFMLYRLHLIGVDFQFNIYGITLEEYLTTLPQDSKYIESLGLKIKFHGFIESTSLRKKIVESDYTILIRDSNRVTLAGFPTKFSESISLGVPVIANMIGDVSKYLKDGINGYAIDIFDLETSISKLKTILEQSLIERNELRDSCIKYEDLSTETWSEKVGEFFREILDC